jgi:hypothetical protein
MVLRTGRDGRLGLAGAQSRRRKGLAVALLLPCIFVLTPLVATLIGVGLGSVGRAWWGVIAGAVVGLWWEWIWVSTLLRSLRSGRR